MPKIPKHTHTLQDCPPNGYIGEEIITYPEMAVDPHNHDNTYPTNAEVANLLIPTDHEMTHAEIAEHQLQRSRLFLETLQKMIDEEAKNGNQTGLSQTINVKELYQTAANTALKTGEEANYKKIIGSESFIQLHDFPENYSPEFSFNETTTRYRMDFNFLASKKDESNNACLTGASIYRIDNRAWETLAKFINDPEKETFTQKKEQYLQGFLKMAQLAGHDYLHHLIIVPHNFANKDTYVFPQYSATHKQHPTLPKNGNITSSWLEDHAFALHARILQKLCGDAPDATDAEKKIGARRKQKILEYILDQTEQITDIQQMAMKNVVTEEDKSSVEEATRYLTEIFYHRVFRVISPLDQALEKPISGHERSIAEALDQITLSLPEPKYVKRPTKSKYTPSGLQKVIELCYPLTSAYVYAHEDSDKVTLFNYGMENGNQVVKGSKEVSLPRVVVEGAKGLYSTVNAQPSNQVGI